MPDQLSELQRRSPLKPTADGYIVDYDEVSLRERKALTAIQVLTFNAKHKETATAISNTLRIRCSTRAGISNTDGKTQISWNGPNSWMIITSDAESGRATGELLGQIQTAVGNLGAVVDQSHGRCCLRLSGTKARQVMAKNTAIDLDPPAFGPGKCALTTVAHMNASIVQVDNSPIYDLFVNRSLARSLAQALQQSCQEYANHR